MMLLILILNNFVDKRLPCGTPCESPNISDKVDPTRTWIDRSARKLSKTIANLPFYSCCKKVDFVTKELVQLRQQVMHTNVSTITIWTL